MTTVTLENDMLKTQDQLFESFSMNLLSKNDLNLWHNEIKNNIYTNIEFSKFIDVLIFTATSLIEVNYRFNKVAARILLFKLKYSIFNIQELSQLDKLYKSGFNEFINHGINNGLLSDRLLDFDLNIIAQALNIDLDSKFNYLGLKILNDRYFLKSDKKVFELPQYFWMRVAMGLALNERDKTQKAIEFYNLIANFDFIPSTPTLFNSGTRRPQLSSCFITTINDDLADIYDAIKDNALLSKYSGGLGNDWTNVRGLGAKIKGTNGESQGIIPFLKVANDTALAVNQGGKRNGATCAYLETWHIDIEDFLDLRKNTGDDRRRTHDMNTANWIPDLFIERVKQNKKWTLFSPDEVLGLHEAYGEQFNLLYEKYEKMALNNELKIFKQINALDLWKKMLTSLYETGHPWITFKDPCNIRNTQSHIGQIHSSNLCTEITLNTSHDEVAVCNLGSINLANHVKDNDIDYAKIEHTTKIAMRMLDNVIDINYYSIDKAKNSNLKHRPVGLGIMGFSDVLFKLDLPFESAQALKLSDKTSEAISYFAILASSELAKERGCYSSYRGSKWDKGILPIDSLKLLAQTRNTEFDYQSHFDWQPVRDHIKAHGMRNSNCMAIAPTATIANIIGVNSSIEPSFENVYVKSNLSGDFTIINEYLLKQLEKNNLLNKETINMLKSNNGSIQDFENIDNNIKEVFKTAFEIEPKTLIDHASLRQKWIDQAISLNLYVANPTGKKIMDIYMYAYDRGLKTTYYLRSKSATNIEKSTINSQVLNKVAKNSCSIDDTNCEACQ